MPATLAEYAPPKTAIDLYRLMKRRLKRNPLTKEIDVDTEGGLSDFQEDQMRAWLKEHRTASAEDFIDWIAGMAAKWRDPHQSHACKVGEISDGSLKKAINLLNGRDPYYGQRIKPADWDDEIDGTFDPNKRTMAPGTSVLPKSLPAEQPMTAQSVVVPASQEITTTHNEPGKVLGVHLVQQPVAPESQTFDVGPVDRTPASPQGGQNPVNPADTQGEGKHPAFRGRNKS